jgi:hypothetical protein
MALLLVGVLSFEVLTMTQVYRGASTVVVRQQMTVDLSQIIQALNQP